jgi:hypothetical protein
MAFAILPKFHTHPSGRLLNSSLTMSGMNHALTNVSSSPLKFLSKSNFVFHQALRCTSNNCTITVNNKVWSLVTANQWNISLLDLWKSVESAWFEVSTASGKDNAHINNYNVNVTTAFHKSVSPTLKSLKTRFDTITTENWLSNNSGGNQIKQLFRSVTSVIKKISKHSSALRATDYLYYDTPENSKLRARLRFNRAKFNELMFCKYNDKSVNPVCELCYSGKPQTVHHILLECTRFSKIRLTLQNFLMRFHTRFKLSTDFILEPWSIVSSLDQANSLSQFSASPQSLSLLLTALHSQTGYFLSSIHSVKQF